MSSQRSLKKNIGFNLVSQIYATLIALIMLPLYIKYMGAEAYGLVGFFAVIQSLFSLLDFGLSPTISRETAKMRGLSNFLEYRQLFRSLSVIFLIVALIGASIIYITADYISNNWLNSENISSPEIILSIQLMSIIVALRWMSGLYRGVIIGFEEITWLAISNIVFSSFRFLGVFVYMSLYGYTPYNFFIFQFFVIIGESLILFIKHRTLLPQCDIRNVGWSIKPIKKILKFSSMIAFTSVVWVLVTQTDKLILSGILPLEQYGYFSLAVLIAAGIMTIVAPITAPLTPKMTKLYAENKKEEMIRVYKDITEIVVIVAGTISLVLFIFSKEVLYLFTGDIEIANSASLILKLYALGNGFLALSAFPSYIQQALGNLKYHFIGNIIILFTLIPLSVISAIKYGAIGAGYVWLILNVLFFFIWVAYSHVKLIPGLHLSWLIDNVLKVSILPIIFSLFTSYYYIAKDSRIEQFFFVSSFGIVIFSLFIFSSTKIRNKISKIIRIN